MMIKTVLLSLLLHKWQQFHMHVWKISINSKKYVFHFSCSTCMLITLWAFHFSFVYFVREIWHIDTYIKKHDFGKIIKFKNKLPFFPLKWKLTDTLINCSYYHGKLRIFDSMINLKKCILCQQLPWYILGVTLLKYNSLKIYT